MLKNLWALFFMMLCTLGVSAAAQQVTLSSTSLNFGSLSAGNVSGSQTITLLNSGSADLTVTSIAASGGFAQTNNCSTMHAGQSCTVEVTYIFAIVGTTKGVLTISDNAASSPQIVNLKGKTLAPIVFAPGNLNFGNVAVGASATKSLTVTNTGVSFDIAVIGASGDYAQTNNCPTTLATGMTCTISVTFHPRGNGTRAGVVAITSRNGGFISPPAAFTAALSGSGTGGSITSQVSVQPASLSFGVKTPVDILQSSLTLKVMNSSASSSLTVHSVSAVGPIYNQVPFYQIGSTNCVGMLAPGAECSITVVQNPPTTAFSPTSAAGSVVIVDSDGTGPSIIAISTNIRPEAQFTPASINFPPQAVGTTSAATVVTVSSNIDETGVSLIPLAVSGDFNVVPAGSHPCGLTPGFGPGLTCTLGVTFTPHQAGPVNGAISFTLYPECQPEQVVILHQPCDVSQTISLSGTGK